MNKPTKVVGQPRRRVPHRRPSSDGRQRRALLRCWPTSGRRIGRRGSGGRSTPTRPPTSTSRSATTSTRSASGKFVLWLLVLLLAMALLRRAPGIKGWTPGKLALGIRVVDRQGRRARHRQGDGALARCGSSTGFAVVHPVPRRLRHAARDRARTSASATWSPRPTWSGRTAAGRRPVRGRGPATARSRSAPARPRRGQRGWHPDPHGAGAPALLGRVAAGPSTRL